MLVCAHTQYFQVAETACNSERSAELSDLQIKHGFKTHSEKNFLISQQKTYIVASGLYHLIEMVTSLLLKNTEKLSLLLQLVCSSVL